jgi:hypothetical protein
MTDEGLDHVLLEQLALVRGVVGRPDSLSTSTLSPSAYQISGTAGTWHLLDADGDHQDVSPS